MIHEWKSKEEIESFGLQSDIEDEAVTIIENEQGEKVTGFKKGLGHYKIVKLKHYLKSIDGKPVKEETIRKLPQPIVNKLLLELDELDKKKV